VRSFIKKTTRFCGKEI